MSIVHRSLAFLQYQDVVVQSKGGLLHMLVVLGMLLRGRPDNINFTKKFSSCGVLR